MKTTSTRALAVLSALAIGLGAAACSKSDTPTPGGTGSSAASSTTTTTSAPAPEAAAILKKAKENALAAKSGAFVGEVDQDGKTIKIDFKGSSDGKTSDIAIEMEGEGKARIISLADAVYIQGDSTFWKQQGAPAAIQKAGDKFIKAPASAAGMAESLSLKDFLEKAFGAITADQIEADIASESVNGVDCWVLTDKKGKAEGALYISKDKSEVVRFTGSTKSPGQLDFSKWNEDLGIKAPPASQVTTVG